MDRVIVYDAEQINASDVANTNRYTMIAIAKLANAILGNGPLINDLECTPTSPASLNVILNGGEYYSIQNIDDSAFGPLPADITHDILKTGIKLDGQNIAITPPATPGDKIKYLIQIAFSEDDINQENRPFFNAPSQNVDTTRADLIEVDLKAGIPDPSPVAPTPDVGYTGAWVITVENGQTEITSGDIEKYDPTKFILEKLQDKISEATGDARYAMKADAAATGDITFSIANSKTGWVKMDDGTIGNAASGATTRANADTQALFTLLWDNVSDTYAPVSGGRGANAAADFAANKTIGILKVLGRALGSAGSGSGLTARTLGENFGAETHSLTEAENGPHTHDLIRDTSVGTDPTAIMADQGVSNLSVIAAITSSGSGTPHNNMQPTVFLNVFIKL